VTVARLGGLEEILQRLVHKARVSEGDGVVPGDGNHGF
jgi:hypothetical protein